MRIAVIDLGTNTFNLLIAKESSRTIEVLYKAKIGVKLGEGGINENFILPEAFNRGLEAIERYKEIINDWEVDNVFAIATSAIRNADNGSEFVTLVKTKFDIDIQVISGDREANYIHRGVCNSMKLPKNNFFIIDIGGGSIEIIIANSEKVLWKHSYELGMARILERFAPSDPVQDDEIIKMRAYYDRELEDFYNAFRGYQPKALIGSSGSFDTFASLILAEKNLHETWFKNHSSYKIDCKEYFLLHEKLIKSTKKERTKMPGMEVIRVEMIVLASIFVNFILLKTGIEEIYQSDYALKEGVIAEFIENIK